MMILASAIAFVAVGAIRSAVAKPIQAWDTSIIARQHRSGAVNYDRLPIDCGPKEQAILRKAYNDIDLLINAVLSNRDGGDSSFLTFFGDGYSGDSKNTAAFGQIFQNFETIKNLLDDTTRDTVVYITCKDESGRCKKKEGIMAYTNYGPNPQHIVHCPKYFNDRGLEHITDLAKSSEHKPHLQELLSYESAALHELLHLTNTGILTTLPDTEWAIPHNKIVDVAKFGVLGCTSKTEPCAIYGAALCTDYVTRNAAKLRNQGRPNFILTANADSYAWFATDRFFNQHWNNIGPRIDPNDAAEGVPDADGVAVSSDPHDTANEGTPATEDCTARALANMSDCKAISIPDDAGQIDFSQAACSTDGSLKWCMMYKSATCQVSIGWDTSKNSGASPQVTNHDIAPTKANHMGSGTCTKYNEVNSGKVFSQKPGRPLTETDNTPWQFCMGMAGQACKFGQSG